MSSDRELKFFMARVADQAERYQDVLDRMNEIIKADPKLNNDERNLLSVAYKALTGSRRSALRTVNAFLEDESIKAIPDRVAKLTELKEKLIKELDEYCKELIELTDQKLLPAADEPATQVFYEKLKADYYRYSVEFKAEQDRKDGADKAKTSYENAMRIAKEKLSKANPAYLGLALNYSVFLYEIIGQKQEAIELAQKTYNECSASVDDNSDTSYSEATMILQLLRDNVSLWTQDADTAE